MGCRHEHEYSSSFVRDGNRTRVEPLEASIDGERLERDAAEHAELATTLERRGAETPR